VILCILKNDATIAVSLFTISSLFRVFALKTRHETFVLLQWIVWFLAVSFLNLQLDGAEQLTSLALFATGMFVAMGIENHRYGRVRPVFTSTVFMIAVVHLIVCPKKPHVLSMIYSSIMFLVSNTIISLIRQPFDYQFQLNACYWILIAPVNPIVIVVHVIYVTVLGYALMTNDLVSVPQETRVHEKVQRVQRNDNRKKRPIRKGSTRRPSIGITLEEDEVDITNYNADSNGLDAIFEKHGH
jgi:hypothetical protein